MSPSLTSRVFSALFLPHVLAFLFLDTAATSSLPNLLRNHGLPAGLFPNSVRYYNVDENGRLEVELHRACFAKYETRVFFDSVIRANLSFGQLKGLEGLSQEELFLWLPVKDIIVTDPLSGLILFDIGVAHKQLSLSLFEDPPICSSTEDGTSLMDGRKKIGFHDQR